MNLSIKSSVNLMVLCCFESKSKSITSALISEKTHDLTILNYRGKSRRVAKISIGEQFFPYQVKSY